MKYLRNILLVLVFCFIICFLLIKSCFGGTYRSFKLIEASLQQIEIDSVESKDSVFYLLDLIVTPQDKTVQMPLTGNFTFGLGIKDKVTKINITGKNREDISMDFSSVPQFVRDRANYSNELILPVPDLWRVVGVGPNISQTVNAINEIEWDMMKYTHLPEGKIHFCRVYLFPKDKPMPSKITVITSKDTIRGTVNNNPKKCIFYKKIH